ncbi:hypothetical protein EV2_019659 [Malus domestica]
MVYSTCSMNPVENEAVVAEILRRGGGSVELIDVSSELPHLVRRLGLKKWKIHDKGRWLPSHKNVSKYRKNIIVPSMFPSGRSFTEPTDGNDNMEVEEKHENGGNGNFEDALQSTDDPATVANEQEEEVSEFPLERCMRIVPHDQNGGAFFIAVFHKHSALPANQGKPNGLKEDLGTRNDEPQVELQNLGTEGTNGTVASLEDGTDETFLEAASEVELIKEELDGASLELDPSVTLEEDVSEEAQEPVDEETDPKKAGGKRKKQCQGKWRGVDPVVFFKDEATINSIKTFYGIDESFPFNDHLVTRNTDANHVKRIYYISKSVKDVLELNFSVGQQLKITSIGLKMFERQTAREGNLAPCLFRISPEGLPLILRQKASGIMSGCCVIVLSKDGEATSGPIEVDESTIAIGCWKGRSSLSVMITAIDCQELQERLLARMETEKEPSEKKDEASSVNRDEVQDVKDIEKER